MADLTRETEDWITKKCRDPEFVKAYLEEQRKMHADDLHVAVAAETERCAKIEPLDVKCPACDAEERERCTPDGVERIFESHRSRWRAAIRRAPESSND